MFGVCYSSENMSTKTTMIVWDSDPIRYHYGYTCNYCNKQIHKINWNEDGTMRACNKCAGPMNCWIPVNWTFWDHTYVTDIKYARSIINTSAMISSWHDAITQHIIPQKL